MKAHAAAQGPRLNACDTFAGVLSLIRRLYPAAVEHAVRL